MADDEDMRSDSESGGDESDSDDSRDEEGGGRAGGASDADLAAVMALEQSLQTHPEDYNLHAQYVALLRRCGVRARLREAREAQAARFPLTEHMWRDWIDDEVEAASRCAAFGLWRSRAPAPRAPECPP